MTKPKKTPKAPPAPPAPPPPPPTKAERLASFIDYLDSRIKHLNEKFEAWRDRLNKAVDDPIWVLGGADSAYEAAAALRVFKQTRDALTKKDSNATLESAAEYARQETFRAARYPRSSTSHTSNLEHACLGAAWAEIAEDLRTWSTAPTSPDCTHLADSTVPGDHLSSEPCPRCERYFVDDV